MKLINGFSGTLSREVSQRELDHRAIARTIAAEGMVLMANDGVLPLAKGTRVALYGSGARHTIIGGTGSGAVNCRPGTHVDQGLRDAGLTVTSTGWLDRLDAAYAQARRDWIAGIYAMSEPGNFDSFYHAHASHPMAAPAGDPITREPDTDVAIYVISRVSGEGADRRPVKGDFLLSDVEEAQLREITAVYPKCVVLLNVGGIMDLSFMDELPISALLLMGQAGMEGGRAVADVLTGAVNPSGRLTDTWGRRFADYPAAETFGAQNGNLLEEKYEEGIYVGYRWFDAFDIAPRYPFGHGLSYTSFTAENLGFALAEGEVRAQVRVTNTGNAAGKQTVLLFAACPEGLRRKERKRLLAFAKTGLLQPGRSETLTLQAPLYLLASYHTGRAAWYLDAGAYDLMTGSDAAHLAAIGSLTLRETVWGAQAHRICPLVDALAEVKPEPAPARTPASPAVPMDAEAAAAMAAYTRPAPPEDLPREAWDLVRGMTLEEKACLVCGRPRSGEPNFIGSAAVHVPGAAAETTSRLIGKGLQPAVLADGPAGIRIQQEYEVNPADGSVYGLTPYESLENRFFGKVFPHEGAEKHYQFCTAIPVGTLLAQSFDPKVLEEAGRLIGREMQEFGVTLWLAPGMNIHRNPLCGRNFEYYSEDPVVSGRMAAALTRGVQSTPGAGVTIKHYACNNQEDNRRGVSSIVSERALREMYLKGFELAIREAAPMAIMTSYNKLNSVHTANSRDLCTVAARWEWGFRGIIMTDWTTTNRDGGSSAAKCVWAGNDLVMPGLESDIHEIMDAVEEKGDQSLALEDLDLCCARIAAMLMANC